MNELNLTTPSLLFSAISLILLAYTNRFLSYASVVRSLNEKYQENPDKDPTTLGQIRNFVLRLRLIRAMQTFGAVSLLLCLSSMFFFSIQATLLAEIVFGGGMVSLAASLVLCIWEIQISTEAIGMHLQNIRRRQREQDPYLSNSLRRNANRREGETLGEQNTRKNQEKQRKEKQDREERKAQERAEREAALELEREERAAKQRAEKAERKEKAEKTEKSERREKQEKRDRVEPAAPETKAEDNDKQEQLSRQDKRERFEQQREERRRERRERRERQEQLEQLSSLDAVVTSVEPKAALELQPTEPALVHPRIEDVQQNVGEEQSESLPPRREQSARPISRRAAVHRVEFGEAKSRRESLGEELLPQEQPVVEVEVKQEVQSSHSESLEPAHEVKTAVSEPLRERKIFANRKPKLEQSEDAKPQEERKSRYQQRQLERQSESK